MNTIAVERDVLPDGLYEGLSFAEYQAIDALNGSSIVHMRRSPMKYRHERDNPTPPSPAMEFGTVIHRMILEPEMVGYVAVWGEEKNQKVRNGAVWNEFRELNAGNLILTVAERDSSFAMSKAVLRNIPIARYAAMEGPTEVSMVWTHPGNGRKYKARIDKLIRDTHTILDLKTTRDVRPWRFGQQAWSLGYVVKMAHYWDGYRTLFGVEPTDKLLAIESKAPHESVVYNIPRDLLILGVEERDNLVWKIEECEKSGYWPAAEQDEINLPMPAWADAESETELALEM